MTFKANSWFLTLNHNTYLTISISEHSTNYFLVINMIVVVKSKSHNERCSSWNAFLQPSPCYLIASKAYSGKHVNKILISNLKGYWDQKQQLDRQEEDEPVRNHNLIRTANTLSDKGTREQYLGLNNMQYNLNKGHKDQRNGIKSK